MTAAPHTPDYAASRAFLLQPGPLSVVDIQRHAAILANSPHPDDRLIARTLDHPENHPSAAARALTAAAARRRDALPESPAT